MDADLSSYFDTIPHAELLRSLARRVADGAMLHLLKMWLETAVKRPTNAGTNVGVHAIGTRSRQSAGLSDQSPAQQSVHAPVGARMEETGARNALRAYIVNYADDLVICCRSQAADSLEAMRSMMAKLKLTVNEAKTRVCKRPEEKFDFLGYTFGRCYAIKRGRLYLGTTPPRSACSACVMRLAQKPDGTSSCRPPNRWYNASTG